MNLWFLGKGWEEGIVREEETVSTVHTAIFKMDNQQGSTIQHKELCSMLCGNLDGREVWGRMDTCVHIGVCVCIAESLCFPPETVTALLISYECESEVAQSCPILSDPMDCSLPGSSIQARVLEWGAIILFYFILWNLIFFICLFYIFFLLNFLFYFGV